MLQNADLASTTSLYHFKKNTFYTVRSNYIIHASGKEFKTKYFKGKNVFWIEKRLFQPTHNHI